MSNPYLIVVIVEGELNQVVSKKEYAAAVQAATDIAAEQCDTEKALIARELISTQQFTTESEDIRVYITTAKND